MNTTQTYISPEIELIRLDREISLQLASDSEPLCEPNWSNNVTDYFTGNPLKEFKA